MYLAIAAFGMWVLAHFAAFGGSAWHPSDYELIPAMSYRLVHGEVPYRDFIYRKPPGSLFTYAPWMLLPERFEVRASRLFVYVELAAATLVWLLVALRHRLVPVGWRLVALSLATTSLALHNFPVTPWYTIDGLFFVALGWAALVESTATTGRRALAARAVASACLAFAVLCKQSFALAAGAFAAYAAGETLVLLAWRRGRAAAASFAASAGPAVLLLGSVALWLVLSHAWDDFVAQLASTSTSAALWEALTIPYQQYAEEIPAFDRAYLAIFATWAVVPLLRVTDGPGPRRTGARARALFPLGLLARDALAFAGDAAAQLGPVLTVSLAGMLAGQAAVAVGLRLAGAAERARAAYHPRLLLLEAGVLVAALSCQISIAYVTPILGVGGFAVALHAVLPEERSWAFDVAPAVLVASVGVAAAWNVNVRAPYRDGPRPELTADLGELFPRLAGIHTTPANFERYAALKQIVTEEVLANGRSFAVLQDYPGIHWLLGTRNPIGIDWNWYQDNEGFEDRLIADLERARPTAIVPKEIAARADLPSFATAKPCNALSFEHYTRAARHVVNRWRLVAENAFFCLYAPP